VIGIVVLLILVKQQAQMHASRRVKQVGQTHFSEWCLISYSTSWINSDCIYQLVLYS